MRFLHLLQHPDSTRFLPFLRWQQQARRIAQAQFMDQGSPVKRSLRSTSSRNLLAWAMSLPSMRSGSCGRGVISVPSERRALPQDRSEHRCIQARKGQREPHYPLGTFRDDRKAEERRWRSCRDANSIAAYAV